MRRHHIKESRGQRISERPTNRPYNPGEDILIQKLEERKIKAVTKANNKYSEELKNEINSIFNDINDGIELIDTFNHSHDDNGFKIQSVEIPLINWYDRASFHDKSEIVALTWDKDYAISPNKKDEYPIFEIEIDYFDIGLCLCDPYKSYDWENTFTCPMSLYEEWEDNKEDMLKYEEKDEYFGKYSEWTIGCIARFNGDWDFFDACVPDRDFVVMKDTLSNALLTPTSDVMHDWYKFYQSMFREVIIELPDNDFGTAVAKQFSKGRDIDNEVSLSFDKDIYKNIKRLVDICEKVYNKW